MELLRNTVLSLASYVRTELNSGGFSSVRVVDAFPDDNLIVTAATATGAPGEVIIPAVSVQEIETSDGKRLGIGESEIYFNPVFIIFVHALGYGQEKDIREFLRQSLADKTFPVRDYSSTGFPDTGNVAPILDYAECLNVRSSPESLFSNNPALKFAGSIVFTVSTVRTTS